MPPRAERNETVSAIAARIALAKKEQKEIDRRRPVPVQTSMIIGRSPLRISLGGGGTDLPSYYAAHGGFVVSAAITQYLYVTMHQTPVPELILRYSQIERVKTVPEIRHPIIREALTLTGIKGPNIEITSMADIPAGTGLGS